MRAKLSLKRQHRQGSRWESEADQRLYYAVAEGNDGRQYVKEVCTRTWQREWRVVVGGGGGSRWL